PWGALSRCCFTHSDVKCLLPRLGLGERDHVDSRANTMRAGDDLVRWPTGNSTKQPSMWGVQPDVG
uniref:Uncharacterized protein n=1 Tax=Anopheles atroparvus TaxID=41427 RepID=A0AAG5DCI4_ANOAO